MLAVLPLLLAQNAAPDLTDRFDVPAGVKVTLWAQSPQLYNPTAIDIDGEGRLWVAEAVNYRQWNGRNPGRHHEAGDRIVVVEDTDSDGVADSSTVFVQDPDLTAPLGIAVIDGAVYVSCSPHLFVYRDTDGDLKADEREVLLTGWGGHDHDHGLHSVVAGPGGGLLWSAGNAGPHLVETPDGWKLRSGSIYNGGGATNPGNRAGLKSDDGRVWTGGIVGRMNDDGTGFQVLAHNFRNQYELAADAFGEMYTADNDDDGNQGCRTVAILEGGDYGYFGNGGASTWGADRRPGQSTLDAHWHQDDPGVMPLGTGNGGGGPTGVAVYEDTLLPGLMGTVLNCDAGRSLVYAHVPERRGAEQHLHRNVLIRPSKENGGERGHWFRPSDVVVGPDGSIYISDWYDPGVGGHAARDREAYGRILRLAPESLATAYGLMNTGLDSPSPNVRGTAERQLLARGDEIPPALPEDKRSQARRIWLKAQRPEHHSEIVQWMGHEDPLLATAARRALAATGKWAIAAPMPGDARSQAVTLALAGLQPVESRRSMAVEFAKQKVNLLAAFDAEHPQRTSARILIEAFGLVARGIEDEVYAALVEQGLEGAELLPAAWRLHPSSALLFLHDYAGTAGHALGERKAAIDAIACMNTPEAADAMVALAHAGPEDTRGQAAWWIQHLADGRWSEFGLGQMFDTDFDAAEELARTDVMKSGSRPMGVDVTGVRTLWLVVEDGGNGNSHDWANFLQPRVRTSDGREIALTQTGWLSAEAGWGQVNLNKDAQGGPLEVDGTVMPEGIGTHAPSKIAFQLPEDAEWFSCVVAIEDSGVTQAGAQTSVRFRIAGERPVDPAERLATMRSAMEKGQAGLNTLLSTTDGALFLLEQARVGALPSQLREELAPKLLGHADLSVRALATEVFPVQTLDGTALPPLAELAAMEGSPARGQELYRGRGTCAVCHRFDGLGGAIGPDLSAIRDKFGPAEMIDAMIHPSAAIAFGYDSWTLTMKDGSILAGSILADGEQVVIRGLDGKRSVIAAADIASRRKQEVSTMPPAQSLGLKAQDLADLAAFLAAEPVGEPVFGPSIPLFTGESEGPGSVRYQLPDGVDPQTVWTFQDGVMRCNGRPAGYIYTAQDYTNFELTLEWRFDPEAGAGNSGVLLRVQEPRKVWPRSIEAQLHSRNAGDIWNIDAFNMVANAERTNGRRTVKALPTNEKPLGEWNRYRIRLHGGQLTLEVNGEIQNTATWCEELSGPIGLQSEGAVIEFRNIRIREIR